MAMKHAPADSTGTIPAGPPVEFRLLGEVEAAAGGRLVDLGHARQRRVLAVLLIEANRVVSADQILDRVWGEAPPQRARAAVHGYLCRLRRVLTEMDGVGLVRRPGGYALTADPMTVDLLKFRKLVAEAREAEEGGTALALFDRALRLWRGDLVAGHDSAWLNDVRHGVALERLAAELDRNDLVLDRGGHAGLLAELTASASAHPLDERIAGQLMLALYRCGRQAGALDVYERLRRLLAEELGAGPTRALRDLHVRILTTDPALVVREPVKAAERPVQPLIPRQLPAPPRSFTGRARQLAALGEAMRAPSGLGGTVTISGAGGLGKTWLALRWAHENADRFPDGQLHVNLRGFDPAADPLHPAVAVRSFLDALGVPPAVIPPDPEAQAAMYRHLTAGRRMLIVLDNARDSAHVAPLLPATPTCAVLVTSRRRLTGLITAHGARPLVLDVLTEAESGRLLTREFGASRTAAEPEAVAAVIRHCGGLPLALGVIAARAAVRPGLSLGVLAGELRQATTRLDALDGGELAVNLRAVLSCSYDALSSGAARVFALLGRAPGPEISLPAVASLTALTVTRTRALLRELVNAHLLDEPVPDRYRAHDLVLLYAAELSGRLDAGGAGLRRLLDHYLHTAHRADRALSPHREPLTLPPPRPGVVVADIADHRAARAWFGAEYPALLATVDDAGSDAYVCRLGWALMTFCDRRGLWHDQAATQRAALEAARRLADRPAEAHAHCGLALAYISVRRYGDAGEHLRQALRLFRALGDRAGQAHAHRCMARLFAQQGHHREALPHDEQAFDLFRTLKNRRGQAAGLNAIGWHHAHLGHHHRALAHCRQALSLYQEIADRQGEAATWDSLGFIRRRLGHLRQAVTCYARALALFRELGARYSEGLALSSLGDILHDAGDPAAAHRHWQDAFDILDQLGHHRAEEVRVKLGGARSSGPSRPVAPRGTGS
ncbi:AfsR/SARP family transcriptional regulator [Nonomuraea ferruginea]|uniref:BTAD domain-containing putative transcriptional regulator n=1 Tax=Nonomuraea ferruginea TaxID=46174 RepID=A0ABT4T3P0_9ACTN|nr:BTAD domain-containing putative transcriptional regulator [Nonomuraea ferruginea]MDA0644143.1 BTAD domain-containing putative transcriptional regulator [Nonomuraea ferruginea]